MFHFRLSAEAYSRLEDLKSVSKASLYYAIEHHKVIFFCFCLPQKFLSTYGLNEKTDISELLLQTSVITDKDINP